MGGDAVEGRFRGGQPYLRVGQGPPLLMVIGLSPRAGNPTGLQRRIALAAAGPFARDFAVHVVNRRPGLAAGTTMTALAGHLAAAVEQDLGGPVAVHGVSTGGSIALQLAVDHPHLVRRLVLASAACRLGPVGRRAQAEFGRRVEAGDLRHAWVPMVEPVVPRPMLPVARGLLALLGPALLPDDPTDLLVTIAAEDAFDAEPVLDRVTAPTLVVGGGADPFYGADLFRRTAAGVRDGRALVLPRRGHAGAVTAPVSVRAAREFLAAGR